VNKGHVELQRLVAEAQEEADRGELLEAENVFLEIAALSAKRRALPPTIVKP
jgi:hypothetical protein